jgi:hypothetical protein
MSKTIKKYFPILLIFFLQAHAFSQTIAKNDSINIKNDSTVSELVYLKPKTFSFLTNIPRDIRDYAKTTFTKDHLPNIGYMTVSTLILISLDQTITDASQNLGSRLNIDPNSSQIRYFGKEITIFSQRTFIGLEGPHDVSSAMYFIGDGWVSIGLSGALRLHGIITKNHKSAQVSAALSESVFSSGIITQLLKHITGRESPFTATAPGGKWRFFPNQVEYHKHVPHYDAFPSGHIAAAMAAVTVLSEFYPEKRFIKPVGYTLMGILMFAMLNNGVHWFSDYPLGIALGYSFAKIAVKKQKRVISRKLSQ